MKQRFIWPMSSIIMTFSFLFVFLLIGACTSDPTPPTALGSPDGIQTATGGARSDSTDKEIKVQTGASQEGSVTQSSADIRSQEETQSTTSGHIQTLGFAGIGNAAQAIQDDPIMLSIQKELDKIMEMEVMDLVRLDKLREDMVARAQFIQSSVSASAPSFDGLKTIVAIFSMENATGHEKTPLTDAAAAAKADAFKTALTTIGAAMQADKSGDGDNDQ